MRVWQVGQKVVTVKAPEERTTHRELLLLLLLLPWLPNLIQRGMMGML